MTIESSASPAVPVAGPQAARAAAEPGRRLDSRQLLAGAREVEIVHGRTVYRLRRTDQDKLILTK